LCGDERDASFPFVVCFDDLIAILSAEELGWDGDSTSRI
jgi:hypothetical protein